MVSRSTPPPYDMFVTGKIWQLHTYVRMCIFLQCSQLVRLSNGGEKLIGHCLLKEWFGFGHIYYLHATLNTCTNDKVNLLL